MSFEAPLLIVLRTVCPAVHPDASPTNALPPYITYQQVGGRPLRYVDNTAADLEHAAVQINVWAASRKQATEMCRAVESALCAATTFVARPIAEPVSINEFDLGLRGCEQDFDIWAARL